MLSLQPLKTDISLCFEVIGSFFGFALKIKYKLYRCAFYYLNARVTERSPLHAVNPEISLRYQIRLGEKILFKGTDFESTLVLLEYIELCLHSSFFLQRRDLN